MLLPSSWTRFRFTRVAGRHSLDQKEPRPAQPADPTKSNSWVMARSNLRRGIKEKLMWRTSVEWQTDNSWLKLNPQYTINSYGQTHWNGNAPFAGIHEIVIAAQRCARACIVFLFKGVQEPVDPAEQPLLDETQIRERQRESCTYYLFFIEHLVLVQLAEWSWARFAIVMLNRLFIYFYTYSISLSCQADSNSYWKQKCSFYAKRGVLRDRW